MDTLTENRWRAVQDLEVNPKRFSQITGSLGHNGNRCALGLLCDTFGINLSGNSSEDAYYSLSKALGLDTQQVITWNDRNKLGFKDIAQKLKGLWKLS